MSLFDRCSECGGSPVSGFSVSCTCDLDIGETIIVANRKSFYYKREAVIKSRNIIDNQIVYMVAVGNATFALTSFYVGRKMPALERV